MSTLHIKHVVTFDKNGKAKFLPNGRKNDVVQVVAEYAADQRVRTASGDVYKAKKLPSGNFETVPAI
jgi:hypothetical protein